MRYHLKYGWLIAIWKIVFPKWSSREMFYSLKIIICSHKIYTSLRQLFIISNTARILLSNITSAIKFTFTFYCSQVVSQNICNFPVLQLHYKDPVNILHKKSNGGTYQIMLVRLWKVSQHYVQKIEFALYFKLLVKLIHN